MGTMFCVPFWLKFKEALNPKIQLNENILPYRNDCRIPVLL
jgi:hypothetical protein